MATVSAGLFALALVLPNHAPPWMSFLQETLAACAWAFLAVGVLGTRRDRVAWRLPEAVITGLLLVVLVQFALGHIATLQTAWMNALYLAGLLLAMQTGSALERRAPGLAAACVLLAMLIAGLLSVWLQVYQWHLLAGAAGDSIWVYRPMVGRLPANLGQPNLLATVFMIALLAVYGLWRTRRWPAAVTPALALTLMAGMAMTQSRTGLLNFWMASAVLTAWHWHNRALRWAFPGFAAALLMFFAGYLLFGQPVVGQADNDANAARLGAGTRLLAWPLLAGAALERPVFGYGWGQTFAAQLAAAPDYPSTGEIYLSAHNLPLDLALWNGLPVALVVIGCWVWWLVAAWRRAEDDGARVMLLIVGVLLVHALTEYPLSFTYFLLPLGLMVGALGQRVGLKTLWRGPRWPALILLAAVLVGVALTVRDYLRVEHSYRQLLFEKARILVGDDRAPPETLVLTSLRDLIAYARIEPEPGMPDAQLKWMKQVMHAHPGAHGFAKLAKALALNHRAGEAQHWVDQLCRVFLTAHCLEQAEAWARWAGHAPALRLVRWPEPDERPAAATLGG
ncbi:MAG: O-antigen ligase C-terminal domain-containing protein [Burkholderiales bacterium]|nr:O-antigen ligase C-terminal domain-containing protein [Burkholderiales bacterium]